VIVLKHYVMWMLVYGLDAYFWAVMIYLLSSFFIQNRHAPWYVFLGDLVEPPLRLLRKWTRHRLVVGVFDLTPLLLFMAIRGARILVFLLFS